MAACFTHEIALPTTIPMLVWTASGPVHLEDENRERKIIYELYEAGTDYDEVAKRFSELIDGDDNWLGEVIIQQENEQEDMPVYTLQGTLTKY